MSAKTVASHGWLAAAVLAIWASPSLATGLLIPTDRSLPPLGIVYQRVNVALRDQTAVTRVEQEFRNSTPRPLEAEYLFPLPSGAGVKDFAMWVGGQRVKAELVEAAKARQVYEDIVRRLKDPGLLEHMGSNLWRVRVFPVPANGLQKIEISYSEIVKQDSGITEYTYPLKSGNQTCYTEQDFTIRVELQTTAQLKSVYSPTHSVSVSRDGDRRAVVGFEAKNYPLNRDFQLFWTHDAKEVGLSALAYRESGGEPGYAMFMISPSVELANNQRVPRDMIFVVDTSGSMQGEKMEQAKRALEFCVKSLDPSDRFGLISFATTTNQYQPKLLDANKDNIGKAAEWIRGLSAGGGTAIDDALQSALALRTGDARNFTVVFLTDGQPTIGETDPKRILDNLQRKNTSSTRVFVFGVGADVNTHLLDQIADMTRSTSVYVRENENLENKVSSFYAKISRPVLSNLRLSLGKVDIGLSEIYPPVLPDLFHGGQLLVLARYTGDGPTTLRLSGKLGDVEKEYVYELNLPREKRDTDFLPGLWARRKVGYLLDQIRLKGENKELVDEVVALAKRHGIATPYTSYLVVPDQPMPSTGPQFPQPHPRPPFPRGPYSRGAGPANGAGFGGGIPEADRKLAAAARSSAKRDGAANESKQSVRGVIRKKSLEAADALADSEKDFSFRRQDKGLGRFEGAKREASQLGRLPAEQAGEQAVEVAEALGLLKDAQASSSYLAKTVAKTTFLNIGGVWVDHAYKKGAKQLAVKYLSDGYFKILKQLPDAKGVLSLGDRVVWVTPSGIALVIDATGADSLTDAEVAKLAK